MKSGKNQQILKPHLFPIVTPENESVFYGDSKSKQDFLNLSSIISTHQRDASNTDKNNSTSNNNKSNTNTTGLDPNRLLSSTPTDRVRKRGSEKPKRPISAPKHRWVYYVEKPASDEKETLGNFPSPMTTSLSLSSRSRPQSLPSSHTKKDRAKVVRFAAGDPTSIDQQNTENNQLEHMQDGEPETLEDHFEKMKIEYQENLLLGKSSLAMEVIGMLHAEDVEDTNQDEEPPPSSRTVTSTTSDTLSPNAQIVDSQHYYQQQQQGLPKMKKTGKIGKHTLAKPGRLKQTQSPNTATLFPPPHTSTTTVPPIPSSSAATRNPLVPTNVMLLAEEVLKKYSPASHHHDDYDEQEEEEANHLVELVRRRFDVPVSIMGPPSPATATTGLLPADLTHAVQRQLARHQLLYPPRSTATHSPSSLPSDEPFALAWAGVGEEEEKEKEADDDNHLKRQDGVPVVALPVSILSSSLDATAAATALASGLRQSISSPKQVRFSVELEQHHFPPLLTPTTPTTTNAQLESPCPPTANTPTVNWKSFLTPPSSAPTPATTSSSPAKVNGYINSHTTKIFRTTAIAQAAEEVDPLLEDLVLPASVPPVLSPTPPQHPPARSHLPSDEVRLNRHILSPRIDLIHYSSSPASTTSAAVPIASYAPLTAELLATEPTTTGPSYQQHHQQPPVPTHHKAMTTSTVATTTLSGGVNTHTMRPQPRAPTHPYHQHYYFSHPADRRTPPDSARSRVSVDLRVPTPNSPAPPPATTLATTLSPE